MNNNLWRWVASIWYKSAVYVIPPSLFFATFYINPNMTSIYMWLALFAN